ncbi:MAG: DUF1002 domain-containing protein [Lachnospiraceae bacterium]|nr:DUF1002 domain-containing protein [Lachnospiraceae bacterium]MEE3461953.1 DUF1002 domain-containing protein [Lachnospiraceae bacterium]
MRRIINKCLSVALAALMTFTLAPVLAGNADALAETTSEESDVALEADDSYDRYLALGADLKADQKTKVLSLLGVDENRLSDYKTVTVTNDEEHKYLDDYLSASIIGSRALSSVKIIKTKEGEGITVVTRNINYCTEGMYQNALITAGIKDADITVAGPFEISGTSALIGVMKAYSEMTGKEISQDTIDAATDELVTTAEVADAVGDTEKVEQLVAAAKQKVFEDQLSTKPDIKNAVESSARSLGVDLTDDQVNDITDMMMKVKDQKVDVNALKEQAENIYNSLKANGIDLSDVDTKGLSEKVGNFFSNIFNAIKDFFTGLFG